MNYKIGIVDGEKSFVNRFKEAMEEQYGNELTILHFESMSSAIVAAKKYGLSALLVGKESDESENYRIPDFPEETAMIYLCEFRSEESCSPDYRKVCKYSNIDRWYEIISETVLKSKKERIIEYRENRKKEKSCKLCLFTSGAGGSGTSTAAAAFSIYCAGKGHKTCYLNFETINSTHRYFESDESIHDFEDVICALRSEKYHAETLMRTVFVEDPVNRVNSIRGCRVQSDTFSLTGEDIINICEMVRDTELFEYIVLDMNFEVSENIVLPFINSDMTVVVSDGTMAGNDKTDSFLSMLPVIVNAREEDIIRKTRILYNRFDRKDGMPIERKIYSCVGGLPVLKARNDRILADKLSALPPMGGLVKEIEKSADRRN